MHRYITFKDNSAEVRLTLSRALYAGFFIGVAMLGLLGRLIYLQVINHDLYTTLSQDNRVKISAVPPTRGRIYDRNGVLLAENLPAFSLMIIPERVDDLEETIKELGELITISEWDLKRFQRLLKSKRHFESLPLRQRLSEEEVARIAVNRHRFSGVDIQAGLLRHYPLGALMTHVVGYVGRINVDEMRTIDTAAYSGLSHIGKIGIEKSYETILRGTVGLQRVETNAEGRVVRILERQPAIPGENLFLNIDTRVQQAADQAFGTEQGALVAIEPSSGAIIAMVSKPSFDPNPFVSGIDHDSFNALRDADSRPLFNRALRGQYPPGSTMKPFMGLAGLEYNVVRPGHKLLCEGYYMLAGDERKYRDWKKEGHGITNIDRALVESCDVYFYDLALNLGIDRIHEYLAQFGFGTKTGVDLSGELNGLLPSREWKRAIKRQPWFPGETLITGIGQGFTLTTPLQLATATASLANHGLRTQPQVLYARQSPQSDEIRVQPRIPQSPIPIIKARHWDRIIKSMRRVVHSPRGTARRINRNLTYTVAGKTGTAQVFGIKQDEEYVLEDIEKKLRDHALFIAFAPVKKPRIAVAVIVENGGSGGAVAAPIVRKVMDRYLLKENTR